MKEVIKNVLKVFRIYHPLQSLYHTVISSIQNALYRINYAKYKGSGFMCNACGSEYEKFVSHHPDSHNCGALKKYNVIAGYGKNIICPNCMSTARERLVLAMLHEMDLEHKKILHFSPEKTINTFIRKSALVTSVDLLPGFYRAIDGNIRKADATRLSFNDNQFEVVIANHILEHIPDDKAAMREIYRVLKPGGRAILQVPYSEIIFSSLETPGIADTSLQSKLYGQKDHVRIYALQDYLNRLRETGFEVSKISYSQMEHFYKYALQENESFFKISKPKA